MQIFRSRYFAERTIRMTGQKIVSICEQLDSSPTPRHLVDFISRQLLKAKFVDFTGKSINRSSSGFVVNAGSVVAWRTGTKTAENGFRIVGAHTDSPCLRIKQNPDDKKFGFNTLSVEIYGSPLLNSWLDRDLGIAGHVRSSPRRQPRRTQDQACHRQRQLRSALM